MPVDQEWETEFPDGVDTIMSGDEIVGIAFTKGRETLTEEEEAQLEKALRERGLPLPPKD